MKEVPIERADLHVGMRVCAHFKPHGYTGQGGEVVTIDGDTIVLVCGTMRVIRNIDDREVHYWTTEVPFDAEECIEYGPDCKGPVDLWHSGGMNGRSWPRCDFHRDRRWESYETSMERYADSDVVPDWFDPSYAGERWFEEDY